MSENNKECGYFPCNKNATKKLKLTYVTYSFCDEHYEKFKSLFDSLETKVKKNE